MKLETVRFVSDRYEWASLAQRAPSVYHRWEWTEQSRRRVAHLLPHMTIETAYMRVWEADTLAACPVILIDDMWYNTPRAAPLIIEGGPADPDRIIEQAAEEENVDLILVDDSDQIEALEALRWELEADCDDHRSRRALIPADVEAMRARLTFESVEARDMWFDGIQWACRSGFDIHIVEYRRNGEPIGWDVTAVHLHEPTVLAAAHVEQLVPAWTSPR